MQKNKTKLGKISRKVGSSAVVQRALPQHSVDNTCSQGGGALNETTSAAINISLDFYQWWLFKCLYVWILNKYQLPTYFLRFQAGIRCRVFNTYFFMWPKNEICHPVQKFKKRFVPQTNLFLLRSKKFKQDLSDQKK